MSWDFETIPKYVINLDRRRDRWQQFQSQPGLGAFKNVRRWSGVDGTTLNLDNDKRVSLFTKRNILKGERRSHAELNTKGGVGCYLSHVGVWQEFMNSPSEVALVLEDDVSLDAGAATRIKQWLASSPVVQNPDMWDFCMLSPHRWSKRGGPVVADDPNCITLKEFTCMAAYLINKRGIRKIMPHVFPIQGHVDWFLSISEQLSLINLCTPQQRLISFINSPTDIHMPAGCDICNVTTDFSKTSALVPKWRLSTYKAEEAVLVLGFIATMYMLAKKK